MTIIAVTGASGFIGRHFQAYCAALGQELRVFSRGDLERGGTHLYAGADAVVHLAGRAHVTRETVADPSVEFRRANVELTQRVFLDSLAAGVSRFVFVSSIGVHGTHSGDVAFTAADAPAPVDLYAKTKHEAEQWLQANSGARGTQLVVVRPTLVAGACAPGNLARLAGFIRRGIPIPVVTGDARRNLVGVRSLAELLRLACIHPAAAGRVLLAAEEPAMTAAEMAHAIAAGIGRRPRLVRLPRNLLRPIASLLGRARDFTRISSSLLIDAHETRELLGWRSPVAIREELAAVGRAACSGIPSPG
jgi:nucleoside-diphosphate-sugar epimerase